MILVTHQLQYLSHCDSIVVLRDGKIAGRLHALFVLRELEHGTYKELIEKKGEFANLMSKHSDVHQSEEEEATSKQI